MDNSKKLHLFLFVPFKCCYTQYIYILIAASLLCDKNLSMYHLAATSIKTLKLNTTCRTCINFNINDVLAVIKACKVFRNYYEVRKNLVKLLMSV